LPKTVLVTGGAGFIGSHVVDNLLKNNYSVIVLDDFSEGKRENLPLSDSSLEIIEGDINNVELLASLVERVSHIVHLAGIVSVPKSFEDPTRSLRVNGEGFLNVLQAMNKINKSIRCVYASSAAVYGDLQAPCDSRDPLITPPLSPYAVEKRMLEQYAAMYRECYGLSLLGLRFFNVYGPRQNPGSPYSGVMTKFRECFKQNKSPVIFGDGEQVRDFIPVESVAQKTVELLFQKKEGILNIASGEGITLNQLIQQLQKEFKVSLKPEYCPDREGDIRYSVGVVNE
jgi:UDP-glucose 4-epimerase